MKTSIHNSIKGKSVIAPFMTYVHNTSKHTGELMEVDFKVKGSTIEYKYTKLKSRS